MNDYVMHERVCAGTADAGLAAAIVKAKKKAQEIDRIVYVYYYDGFFYMTDDFSLMPWIAKCYPGGRVERKG